MRPSPPEQLEALALVLPSLEKRDERALEQEFRLPGNANGYLEWLNYARTMPALKPAYKYLRPAPPEADVIESLASQIGRGELNQDSSAVLQNLLYIDAAWDWVPVVDALKGRLGGPHATLPTDFVPVVETLFGFRDESNNARHPLLEASSEDGYFQHLQLLLRANQYDPAAMLILAILSNGRPLQPPPRQLQRPQPPQWIQQQRMTFLSGRA